MGSDEYAAIEVVVSLGVALALGVWQLRSAQRARRRLAEAERSDPSPPSA